MSGASTRRRFLRDSALAGAGLVLSVHVPDLLGDATPAPGPAAFEPNAYLRIGADDSVTVWVIRHEMGQGVRTLLPMILAEELDADWSRIRIEQAVTEPRFNGIRLHTSGSGSSRGAYRTLRAAGAAAREMLVEAAARRWSVPATELTTRRGAVAHAASGRRATYGELAAEAAGLPVPKEPKLKSPSDFTLLGKPMKRVDGPEIVSGGARYGLDVRLPGMLVASVERAPALQGRLVRFDASALRPDGPGVGASGAAAALARPGVLHVVPVTSGIQQGVAVVARDTWTAMEARAALKIEWDLGRHAGFDSDAFLSDLDGWLEKASFKVRHEGDATGALAGATRRHTATYSYPYQAHAPMETMNCVADVKPDSAEFWVPTQTQHRCMEQAKKVTGLPEEKIRIHATLMGGGFGRRLFADYLAEAAEISKAIGKPVQVVWTRQDDTRDGYFQPATKERLEGGLDASGKLVALWHRSTVSDLSIYHLHAGKDLWQAQLEPEPEGSYAEDQSPWGAFDNPYEVPNLRVDCARVPTPVPLGPWRAVSYPSTVFGRESFLDELAHLAGRDPLDFRLALLSGGARKVGSYTIDSARLARVHRLAAEKAGWGKPLPPGGPRLWGRGIAANVYHGGSYVAQVAEVSVARDLRDVKVHRVVTAADCGLVLNPLGIEFQTEGGVAWALSAALFGKVDFRKGRALQGTFDDLKVVRLADMPSCETLIVPSPETPAGYGEHPVPAVAPAVANAVFAATGIRVRRLPIDAASLAAARSEGPAAKA